ncbi:MAG: pyridoxamine 5'-phosphate oxidase family protein [Micropruina sp.]|uniref:pyridoxamine 5'-phosphate oxidase family protein n=1 Tax=Micropruina sp. TaxID=2737536 RepID=UPI0039E46804
MAQRYDHITDRIQRFIEAQHMFFVATAARTGRVNVSPKGLDTLRILEPNRVAWLNLTGSGNETAAHILDVPRMTLMFCAFEGNPWIVRLFGTASMVQPGEDGWDEVAGLFPPQRGSRQVYLLDIDLVLTSCGFGVPLYSYDGQRDLMDAWATKKGDDGLLAYQREFNAASLDGLPTGLVQDGRHV